VPFAEVCGFKTTVRYWAIKRSRIKDQLLLTALWICHFAYRGSRIMGNNDGEAEVSPEFLNVSLGES